MYGPGASHPHTLNYAYPQVGANYNFPHTVRAPGSFPSKHNPNYPPVAFHPIHGPDTQQIPIDELSRFRSQDYQAVAPYPRPPFPPYRHTLG
eukprot:c17966_g1_i4.p2 GENE.c17966_g1_i4~~c17966_g1_i4.p2  ORF type:complete len:106 (+),score=8.51 c17966_g1_i4:45-320(+)